MGRMGCGEARPSSATHFGNFNFYSRFDYSFLFGGEIWIVNEKGSGGVEVWGSGTTRVYNYVYLGGGRVMPYLLDVRQPDTVTLNLPKTIRFQNNNTNKTNRYHALHTDIHFHFRHLWLAPALVRRCHHQQRTLSLSLSFWNYNIGLKLSIQCNWKAKQTDHLKTKYIIIRGCCCCLRSLHYAHVQRTNTQQCFAACAVLHLRLMKPTPAFWLKPHKYTYKYQPPKMTGKRNEEIKLF